ncbi:MAG TPA: hypothetical protein VM791_15400, partial [Vicinamibacterales bacterium]|nr:hypothetical protein [Vicinamibacterales bacterium]
MENPDFSSKSSQAQRWQVAADRLKLILEKGRWQIKGIDRQGRSEGDFRVRSRQFDYSVELKAASEGRADRLIPL